MNLQANNIYIWILRLVVALILLQTLYFKFTGAPKSVYIFSSLGVEPFGRYFAGLSELTASILLLVPGFGFLGAAMSAGIMAGAILSHLLILGIEVQEDGGLLFTLACLVFVISLLLIYLERELISMWIKRLKSLVNA